MGKISTKELDNQMKELRGMLTLADLWGQLAEEASELAQAALKMQRLELGNNPPRKTPQECINNVIEEHADVDFCFKLLRWDDKKEREVVQKAKAERWMSILKGVKVDHDKE